MPWASNMYMRIFDAMHGAVGQRDTGQDHWDDVQWEMGMVMGFVGPWPCGCA